MNLQDLKNKIADYQGEIIDKNYHLTNLDKMLTVSMWLTFLLYLAFALSLYVGDIWHLQTLLTSFAGGSFGMLFFGVIALLLAYMLAGTKHAAYKHFSMFPTVKIVVMLAMLTGIVAEVFNSSGVQDIKARAITDNSQEYNALVKSNTETGITIPSALVHSIAAAEQRLARCKVNLAIGKEKHCDGDQAKLDGLKNSQQSAFEAQVTASTEGQSARFERLDALKNDSYNPVIKSISSSLAIKIASAVALVMLVFAIIFECMHYYLAVMRRDTTHLLTSLREMIRRAKSEYYSLTGQLYDDAIHGELNQHDPAEEAFTKSAGEEPTNLTDSPKKRFKWQAVPAVGAGIGIESDGVDLTAGAGALMTPKACEAPTIKPYGTTLSMKAKAPLSEPEEQPKNNNNEPEEKTKEPEKEQGSTPERKKSGIGFTANVSSDQPVRAPSNTPNSAVYHNNVRSISQTNMQAKHAGQNMQTGQPKHAKIGSLNTQDFEQPNTQKNVRVLRARTQKHAETRTPEHAENTQSNTQDSNAKHADSDELFTAFVAALKAKRIKPTVSASRKFVQQKIAASQQTEETPTLVQCGKIANLLIRKATIKKVLIKNPKKGNNQPNHILNGDES